MTSLLRAQFASVCNWNILGSILSPRHVYASVSVFNDGNATDVRTTGERVTSSVSSLSSTQSASLIEYPLKYVHRRYSPSPRIISDPAPSQGACDMPAESSPQQQEQYIHVRSFLLSSSFDLKKLKPKFSDVLLAHGNDYLVLGFHPSNRDAGNDLLEPASPTSFPLGPSAMSQHPGVHPAVPLYEGRGQILSCSRRCACDCHCSKVVRLMHSQCAACSEEL
jgi:hypothetical protein